MLRPALRSFYPSMVRAIRRPQRAWSSAAAEDLPAAEALPAAVAEPGHQHHGLPRLQDLRQGDKIYPVFTQEEFDQRIAKLRLYMSANDIEAVVLTSHHNINYFTGFMYTSFGRKYGVAITHDKNVTISAGIDGGQPYRRSHGDNIAYTDWRKDNYIHAVQSVLGDVRGKMGLEFDHKAVDRKIIIDQVFPNTVDIGEASMRIRMTKSQEEIEVIRQGARIADIGGAALVAAVKEGVPEFEVALTSTATMVREIAKTYPDAEFMDTWTWFQSGLNTDGAHNPLTARRVQKGDILSLNCFPMIAGYYTALERTLFYDHATDEHLRLWEINCEVHRLGLSLIKPGVRCCDIAHELNELYKQYDLLKYRSFGYGHSFGSLSHYYGREADLELREDVETKLEPGMVISMEPMISIPEGKPGAGGYREHDILIITESGAENITHFPFGPEHNIIEHRQS